MQSLTSCPGSQILVDGWVVVALTGAKFLSLVGLFAGFAAVVTAVYHTVLTVHGSGWVCGAFEALELGVSCAFLSDHIVACVCAV